MPRAASRSLPLSLLAGLLLAFAAAPAAQAVPLVEFVWDPPSQSVAGGATSTTVTLTALQSGGADAAGITLGFEVSGIVTGVSLLGWGSAVSAADSFFGNIGSASGPTGVIAVAPSTPGSFGLDVDFEIATLTLTLDTALGGEGAIALLDLSDVAGFPAADRQAGAIPSDLSAVHTVVPEPATALLCLAGLAGLGALGRRPGAGARP
jgi:uncharacterized protein (TIGR03382 family)